MATKPPTSIQLILVWREQNEQPTNEKQNLVVTHTSPSSALSPQTLPCPKYPPWITSSKKCINFIHIPAFSLPLHPSLGSLHCIRRQPTSLYGNGNNTLCSIHSTVAECLINQNQLNNRKTRKNLRTSWNEAEPHLPNEASYNRNPTKHKPSFFWNKLNRRRPPSSDAHLLALHTHTHTAANWRFFFPLIHGHETFNHLKRLRGGCVIWSSSDGAIQTIRLALRMELL